MHRTQFPVIDLAATGENILRLRKEKGLSVRDLQGYFGFEEPQAIYKWQKGKSLPTVDNLYALSALLNVPMDDILVPTCPQLNIADGQQDSSCCQSFFIGRLLDAAKFRAVQTNCAGAERHNALLCRLLERRINSAPLLFVGAFYLYIGRGIEFAVCKKRKNEARILDERREKCCRLCE